MTTPKNIAEAYADAASIVADERDQTYSTNGKFLLDLASEAILARAAEVAEPAMPALAAVIEHYGIDALCKVLAPEIVREAGEPPAPWMPPHESERRDGYECLATVRVVWDQVSGVWRTETGDWIGCAYSAAFAPLPGDAP
jgi:hypothetical protein